MREPVELSMQDDNRASGLEVLDPGYDRPGYWRERRAAIMERVSFELARRRPAARESVAAVLTGWSRSLIPAGVAAAAIAAVLVTAEARRDAQPEPQLVLQDILGVEADERSFEALLNSDRTASAGAFMALVEGGNP